MSMLFDYSTLSRKSGVSAEELRRLEEAVRSQHRGDEMMFELRMLRTLDAIADWATTPDDAIRDLTSDPGPGGSEPGLHQRIQSTKTTPRAAERN